MTSSTNTSGSYKDEAALAELRRIQGRVGEVWKEGTGEVLKSRNPALWNELSRIENALDSLILIPKKPKPLQKELKALLVKYENTCKLCMQYAARHLPA